MWEKPAGEAALVIACLFGIVCGFPVATAFGAATSTLEAQIAANNQQVAQLNQEIASYETKLQQIGADKKTLQQAINALDLQRKKLEAQIAATQRQIDTSQLQIQRLSTNISDTQQQIDASQAGLAEEMRSLQHMDGQPFIAQMLSSTDLTDLWGDVDLMSQIGNAIRQKVLTLRGQENDLANSRAASKAQQSALIAQRSSLSSQQTSLSQTKRSKTQLLAETNSKESTYQQLLAEAQAELASFSTFAQNAGGSGLLSNQTACDSWGCYYNQRDSAWGNDPLDGTQYALKSDGCLITAVAMVMTHYGYRDVTPVTINSDPSNFAAYYPAYLLLTIHVDGKTVSRRIAAIDATLATGNPVIVGVHAYGGTHFVVLVSGSHGNYTMRDPYIPNGKDVSFTAHYSLRSIYSIRKVVIS